MGYVTFLLDLLALSEGAVRPVASTLAFGPAPETRPANAFAWKVTHDSDGVVAIRALRDKRLVLIAHARLSDGTLSQRQQRDSEPTSHQWHAIQEGLRDALAARSTAGADDAPISEPIDAADLAGMAPSGTSVAQAIVPAQRAPRRRGRGDRGDDREWRGWDRPRPMSGRGVLVGLALFGLASAGVYVAVGRSARRGPAARTSSTPPAPVAAPAPAPTASPPTEAASSSGPASPSGPSEPSTLDEAIAQSPALAVAELAAYRVRWSDVDRAPETTLAKVEKDPQSERGKRACAEGTLERITRRDLAGRPHFEGALVTKDGDRVAFVVGGSTGELVKRDRARLCGVVTGVRDGATALFGMFDLPENRAPIVEKP